MIYHIEHETVYSYSDEVSLGHSLAYLRPSDAPGQRCLEHQVHITPGPAARSDRADVYGNRMVVFAVQQPHREMTVRATSRVEVDASSQPLPAMSPPWEQVRDALVTRRVGAALDACQFVFDSPLVKPFDGLTDYAKPSFPQGRPVLDGALDLCHRIYQDFRYDPATTTVATPLAEAFAQRSGVCQDFAHLMIGALRGLGLAARYVSGYLRTFRNPEDRLTGADASHAWLAVYAPGIGWIPFDPTNDQVPAENHISVAWGRDFGDVSPVRGVILGGGDHKVEVRVEVNPQ